MIDIDIYAWDIGNAYLNAPCWEKLWTKVGSEFGSEKECFFLIVRALYWLNLSGENWRTNIEETLNSMGYRYNEPDPDVWIKRESTENGIDY